MRPPDPLPPPGASLARAAADLIRALAGHGHTGIYTATAARFAVLSTTADLTVWTNGHQFWCTHHGQRLTWPAADLETAATRIAALAHPAAGSRQADSQRRPRHGTNRHFLFNFELAYQPFTTPFPLSCVIGSEPPAGC